MNREIGDYVQDVIDVMGKSMKFIEGMEYEEFIRDDKTTFAVIRTIEVIGEAVKNISEDVKKEYPEVPPLKPIFEKILKDLEEGSL